MTVSSVKLFIPDIPLTQDQELFQQLLPIYQSIRSLQAYMTNNLGAGNPSGNVEGILANASATVHKLSTVYALATVAMVPGTLVYFTALNGKLAVAPSQAAGVGAFECQGIIASGLPAIVGELCAIKLLGVAQVLYSGTPYAAGQFLYLSPNPGGLIEANPNTIATANVRQRIGFALDAYTDADNNTWQNIWFSPNYGLNVI